MLRRLYYEAIRTTEAEAAQTVFFELLIECGLTPGLDGVSPIRADFERGVVEGIGGPSALTDLVPELAAIGEACIARAT